MSTLPRLNGIIRALESGQHAFTTFALHVEPANAERIIKEGYRYLMCAAPRSFAGLEKARGLAGRG